MSRIRAIPSGDDVPIPSGDDVVYIVMFSGGLSSYEAARRCVEKFGVDRVRLWFADTMTEDPDLYRFNADVERLLRLEIRVFTQHDEDGVPMGIWEMMRKHSMIANSQKDPCSKFLKRAPLRKALEAEFTPRNAVVVLGMDNIEDCGRAGRARENQRPFACYLPLLEGKTPFKAGLIADLRALAVEPPALYGRGFRHNNCGGFCVKAGFGQMAHLLKEFPDRYAYHEAQESALSDHLIATGSQTTERTVLRKRTGGYDTGLQKVEPFSLKALRESIEAGAQYPYDPFDSSQSCSCFNEWFED